MTALPQTLEEVLHHQGYTIDTAAAQAFDITLPQGTIHVPPMQRSTLTWRRPETPQAGADMYLSSLPLFSELYRPVLLSSILDRFRTRRIGYNTPGEFRLAVRRWGNLNMTIPNRRYVSTAVDLPLDDRDSLDEVTGHGLDVESDFPQSQISGDADYASRSSDRRRADNIQRTGRETSIMALLEEQRRAFLNVDAEVIDAMESLFLSLFDSGESRSPNVFAPPPRPVGFGPFGGFREWGC